MPRRHELAHVVVDLLGLVADLVERLLRLAQRVVHGLGEAAVRLDGLPQPPVLVVLVRRDQRLGAGRRAGGSRRARVRGAGRGLGLAVSVGVVRVLGRVAEGIDLLLQVARREVFVARLAEGVGGDVGPHALRLDVAVGPVRVRRPAEAGPVSVLRTSLVRRFPLAES